MIHKEWKLINEIINISQVFQVSTMECPLKLKQSTDINTYDLEIDRTVDIIFVEAFHV